MEIRVLPLQSVPAGRRPIEVVERKGLGHPDSICDAVADAFSRRLCRFYLERFGQILHHNVDKILLRAGAARPAFGGGEVLEPIELWLCGRATERYRGVSIPVAELAEEATRSWFKANFHALDAERHVRVHCVTRPGSTELLELFARPLDGEGPLANDTSCAVGFAPATALERAVLRVETELNGFGSKRSHPQWGQDVKVLGLRRDDHVALTVACAFVGSFVADLATYRTQREHLVRSAAGWAAAELARPAEVVLNAADNLETGDVYLTVTGTSAEAGDDGEVGRGNRANGLITPFRPMTLEAAAGKNPVTHVGKVYNLEAPRIAAELVERLEMVEEACCTLVSCIGRSIQDPVLVALELGMAPGVPLSAVLPQAEEIARARLGRLASAFWKDWVETDS
jgi:S-adenosylmethionine synthetase